MKRRFRRKRMQSGIFQRRCTIRKGFVGRGLPPENMIQKAAEGDKPQLLLADMNILPDEASLDSPCNRMRGHVEQLEREVSELYGVRLSVIAEPGRLTQEISELDKTQRTPRL